MTRIVAGSAKGRILAVPKSGTRPTSERVREALFSRLDHMNVLNGTVVLDLYAGTGALGLEALSRGSARATLVEKASAAARVASANVRSTGLPARVVTADARAYLAARTGEDLCGDVDLVFIDPPSLNARPVRPRPRGRPSSSWKTSARGGKPSPISRVLLCPRKIFRTARMLPERPRPRR